MMQFLAIAVTVLGYLGARRLQRAFPSLHPLLIATPAVWLAWWGMSGDWQTYKMGGEWITFWLGPATVALAVPLVKHIRALAYLWKGVLLGVTVGCTVSLLSGWLVMQVAGGDDTLARSMLTKSVTTPFAVELTLTVGGVPALAALFSVVTGLIGAVMARTLFKLAGIRDDWAIGIAVGTSSHAIGTASLPPEAAAQTAASSLAMILAGLVTSLLLLPF
ncbi:LrgB family protein [Brevibacillus sp. SYP-B805]|uniref:LrgB family protein n=1 Tax=Brevibacillus sp. SYP-B805 TaxID=1578199 RepID=UPI0019CFD7EE|nr:LrgB family protein [Brevibacillus sp. SYP-B805]